MPTLPLEPPPIRLTTRLLAGLQASILSPAMRMFDGDLDRVAIYSVIARETYRFQGEETVEHPAISAHSLAMSLSRPYETVRRHVNAMVEDGLCERTVDGVRAAPAAMRAPEILAYKIHLHDCAVRFIHDLQRFGVPMPRVGAAPPYQPAAGIRTAIDLMLAVTDSNRRTHGDWMELVIFSTIYCANSQRMSRDRVLSRRHADGMIEPPPELRDPVRTSVIARVLSLPEPTVRRRVKDLITDGRVERAGKQLLVSESWLNAPDSIETSTRSFHTIRLILARLGASGFPFHSPADAYIHGRPADVAFD
jgi:hypothetical protein